MMLRFDVFGRQVGITREDDRWHAVFIGPEGAHREARGIEIPSYLEEGDLQRFLADLYHESASPDCPDVVRLEPAEQTKDG